MRSFAFRQASAPLPALVPPANPDLLQVGLVVRRNADVIVLVVVQELIGESKITINVQPGDQFFAGEDIIRFQTCISRRQGLYMANNCIPAYGVPELSVIVKVFLAAFIGHPLEETEKPHLSRLLSLGVSVIPVACGDQVRIFSLVYDTVCVITQNDIG